MQEPLIRVLGKVKPAQRDWDKIFCSSPARQIGASTPLDGRA
jgi:hypothetical protein